jgi:hypothetical protein
MSSAMFDLSSEAAAGCDLVCRIDEVGRGPAEAHRRTGAESDR